MAWVGGSCHCGRIKYRADVGFDDLTFRCNCSICTKSRAWILPLDPARLVVESGLDEAGIYTFGEGGIEHIFCRTCGIKPFGKTTPKSAMHPFAVVNVATLDLQPEDLARFAVKYADGLHDSQEPPPVVSYL